MTGEGMCVFCSRIFASWISPQQKIPFKRNRSFSSFLNPPKRQPPENSGISANRPIPWRKQRKLNVMHGAWIWPWNSSGVNPAETWEGPICNPPRDWWNQKWWYFFFLKQKKVGGVLFCQRKGVIFAKGSLNDGLLVVFRFGLLC